MVQRARSRTQNPESTHAHVGGPVHGWATRDRCSNGSALIMSPRRGQRNCPCYFGGQRGALTYPLIAAPSHQPGHRPRTSARTRPRESPFPRLVAGAQPAAICYKAQVHTQYWKQRRGSRAAKVPRYLVLRVGGGTGWPWQVSLTIPSPWGPGPLPFALTLTLAALLLSPLPSKTPTAGPSQSSPPASATPRLPPQAPQLLLLPLRPHPLPSFQLLQTDNSPKRRPVREREREREREGLQTQPPDLVLILSRAARFLTLHQSVSWHTLQ